MEVIREHSETTIDHPEFFHGWTRVDKLDHPAVSALYDGAPDLGWSADPRLCLYRNDMENRYLLARLEADGEYRMVIRSPRGEIITPESINRLIAKLIEGDRNRGVDIIDATLGWNERKRVQMDKEWDAERAEVADKLVYALNRMYLPGMPIFQRLR